MTERNEDRQRKWSLWSGAAVALLVVATLAAVLIVALLVSLFSLGPEIAEPDRAAATEAERPAEVARPAPASIAPSGRFTLASGEAVEIDMASLQPGRPVELQLQLPAVPAGVQSLTARVISTDGRVHDATARVAGSDRDLASLSIDGAFLAPTGRYLIELKTQERSHFPVRRYVVEVR